MGSREDDFGYLSLFNFKNPKIKMNDYVDKHPKSRPLLREL